MMPSDQLLVEIHQLLWPHEATPEEPSEINLHDWCNLDRIREMLVEYSEPDECMSDAAEQCIRAICRLLADPVDVHVLESAYTDLGAKIDRGQAAEYMRAEAHALRILLREMIRKRKDGLDCTG